VGARAPGNVVLAGEKASGAGLQGRGAGGALRVGKKGWTVASRDAHGFRSCTAPAPARKVGQVVDDVDDQGAGGAVGDALAGGEFFLLCEKKRVGGLVSTSAFPLPRAASAVMESAAWRVGTPLTDQFTPPGASWTPCLVCIYDRAAGGQGLEAPVGVPWGTTDDRADTLFPALARSPRLSRKSARVCEGRHPPSSPRRRYHARPFQSLLRGRAQQGRAWEKQQPMGRDSSFFLPSHLGDLEDVPARAGVRVGLELVAPLHVLDLDLLVRHGLRGCVCVGCKERCLLREERGEERAAGGGDKHSNGGWAERE